MNNNRIQTIVIRMIEKQCIDVQDVRDLQDLCEEGGFITREEAEALFRAERMVPVACDSWGEFFVEALTAHVVWERRPTGRITAEDVAWLVDMAALPRNAPCERIGMLLVSVARSAVTVDGRLLALVQGEAGAPAALAHGLREVA